MCDSASAAKRKRKVFQLEWLKREEFKHWLKPPLEQSDRCRCIVCKVELTCGKSELQKHAIGKKHLENMKAVKTTPSISTFLPSTKQETEHIKNVKVAEIKLASFFAEHNVAYLVVDHLIPLLQNILPDSQIMKDVKLKRTKCTEVVNNVICKYETNMLVSQLRENKFSVLLDESTDTSGDKTMCILARYTFQNQVQTRLLELVTLDARDCTSQELYKTFKKCLTENKIPVNNVIGAACDGASVMVGKHNSFFSHLHDEVPHAILLRCICHSSAIVASKACEELPRSAEELLRSAEELLRCISTYISGSAKRCAILQEFQEYYNLEKTKILKLATTRWLSMHQCIERILLNWDALESYFRLAVFEDKLRSSELILSSMQNICVKSYLLFLKYALNFFNTFNALFQSRQILIHKLYSNSVKLLKQLCVNYMKPDVYSQRDMRKINLAHPNNFLELNKIHVGEECMEEIKKLPVEGREEFLKKCLSFYITAAVEIQARLPLNELFSEMQFLDPHYAFYHNNRTNVVEHLNYLSGHFRSFIDSTKLSIEWNILPVSFSNEDKTALTALPLDKMWLKIASTVDFNDDIMFPNIGNLATLILTLPHSNAESERIFSIVTDVKTKKRNRLGENSLNAIAVIRSSLQNNGTTCVDYNITKEHLDLHNVNLYSFKRQ